MLSKLVPLLGNVCEANLGIDEDTANMMAKEVDVIVNSAANTTFDERFVVANLLLDSCLCMSMFSFSCLKQVSILMKFAGTIFHLI